MLATYQLSGRLQKVHPEAFDDELEQFCRLGRLVGRDTVKVSAYAMALVVFIPVELIFTGPILLVSLLTAWITIELVLNLGDSYRRAHWELAEEGIETSARRLLWMRYIKPLAGIYTNHQLMKGLFGSLDRELRTFERKQKADLGLFGMLDLIGNIERITMMTIGAVGIVTGFFDISQFVLILFVGGRLQGPLRGILQIWLTTARPVQAMQLMQRLIKDNECLDSEELLVPQQVEAPNLDLPLQERSLLWRRDVPLRIPLQDLGLDLEEAAFFRGEAITVNGSLLENLTLGQSALNQTALSLLAWSGLQPWVASLPHGVETKLEEDSAILPHYVTQLLSAFRVFLFNTTVPVVIDNRAAQLEPETISGLVNVLQRWPSHPQVTILSTEEAWSQLNPEIVD
jgi:ABC-type bacteriocin/lantibiotic exporter with double-glycine peptidase domain